MAGSKSGAAPAAPHHAMVARKGEPNETYSVVDARGVETKVIADSSGLVQPQTTEQVRVADAHKLPAWPSAPAASEPPAAATPAPLTLAELKAKAAELGLDVPAKAKKAELEALIAEAEAAANTSEEDEEE